MMLKSLLVLIAFPAIALASSMQLPVGKCRYPLPSNPGFNTTMLEGETFKYIYTPSAMVYKAVDSISMVIRKLRGQENLYAEIIKARSILGTPTSMSFKVKDLGDGILQKMSTDGEMGYIASVVAIKGDVGMLYVCSDDGDENGEDFRFVIARKWVNHDTVKHPDIMFRATNAKFNFHGKFRKLPQHWSKKNL